MDPHNSLNDLDYTVLGVIGLSGFLALMRGFVREILSLAAWGGAYFIAAKLYPMLEPSVHRYIKNQTAVTVIAVLSLFIFTLVILSLIANFISSFVQGTKLTSVDRSLGFIFGLLRGALVVSLIYLGAVTVIWPDADTSQTIVKTQESDKDKDKVAKMPAPEWLMEARTRPAMAYGARELKAFIPQGQVEKTLQKYTEQKAAAQRVIDQQKLDLLSTPTSSDPHKEGAAPSYDDKSRQTLDQLINQKGTP